MSAAGGALLLSAFLRLLVATLLAATAFFAFRTPTQSILARLAVWIAGLAFAATALVVVLWAIPFPRIVGLWSADIVASAAFIGGFAVEGLIGEEVRRLFR